MKFPIFSRGAAHGFEEHLVKCGRGLKACHKGALGNRKRFFGQKRNGVLQSDFGQISRERNIEALFTKLGKIVGT